MLNILLNKMSEKTRISSIENNLEISKDEFPYFRHILMCNCNQLHEFSIVFKKEHFISFPCMAKDIKFNELNESNILAKKCDICKKEIIKGNDFCKIHEDNTEFICENCVKDDEDLDLTRISEIISKAKNEDGGNFRNDTVKKLNEFININLISTDNVFYNKCLADIKLFEKFVKYLCFLKKLYGKKNKANKIIKNFLDYTYHFISIASSNIQLYDLYHFNKETIIYSFCNDEGKRFLSKKFKTNYR